MPPVRQAAPFHADAPRQDPLDSLPSRVFTMLHTPLTDLYTSRPYVATGNPVRPVGNDRNLLWGWLLSTQNYPDDPVRARVPEPQAANSETGPASESRPFGEMTFGLFIRYPAFRP